MKLSQQEVDLIEAIRHAVQISAGGTDGGSKVYGNGTEVTGVSFGIISVREDGTMFDSLVCTDGHTELDDTYFYLLSATPKKGDILVAPKGYRFTSFELSSGSIAVS